MLFPTLLSVNCRQRPYKTLSHVGQSFVVPVQAPDVLENVEIPQDTSHFFIFISPSMINPGAAFAEGVRR
jgi:hypothetical protein